MTFLYLDMRVLFYIRVNGLEGGRFTPLTIGLSSGGKTLIEGPPFNYYNYQAIPGNGDITV